MKPTKICPRCETEKARAEYNKGRSECRACGKSDGKRYRQTLPRIAYRLRYQSSPEYKAAQLKYAESERGRHIKPTVSIRKLYGITRDQHAALFYEQGGKCAVCLKVAPGKRRLCVDHDHVTGEVRGLVCICCNLLIAQIERADETAIRARAYLSNPPARLILEKVG